MRIRWLAYFVILCLIGISTFYIISSKSKNQISSVTLPEGLTQEKYIISHEKSYEPYFGSIDVYNANEADLIKVNYVDYNRSFGLVKNERSAVDIATIVFYEIYEDCHEKETPYIVKYNKNAGAWIVHGSLPSFTLGGVASVGIKKDTGEILFVLHTK